MKNNPIVSKPEMKDYLSTKMSNDEVDEALREMGVDPESCGKRGEDFVRDLLDKQSGIKLVITTTITLNPEEGLRLNTDISPGLNIQKFKEGDLVQIIGHGLAMALQSEISNMVSGIEEAELRVNDVVVPVEKEEVAPTLNTEQGKSLPIKVYSVFPQNGDTQICERNPQAVGAWVAGMQIGDEAAICVNVMSVEEYEALPEN